MMLRKRSAHVGDGACVRLMWKQPYPNVCEGTASVHACVSVHSLTNLDMVVPPPSLSVKALNIGLPALSP